MNLSKSCLNMRNVVGGIAIGGAVLGLSLTSQIAYSQDGSDFEQKIEELKQNAETSAQNATTALQNDEYSTATIEFGYAAQYSRQLKGYSLAQYLPEPKDGWTTENLEVESAAAAMFGGGTTVKQDYVSGDERVTLSILTDSPLMQSVMMMLNNPMIMMGSNQGNQTVMINNQRAMVETKSNGNVTVSLPHAGVYLLQGEGPQEAVVTHMNEINYTGLATAQ